MRALFVSAVFPPGPKTYDYFVPDGDEPVVGDYIVTSFNESADLVEFRSEKFIHVAKVVDVHIGDRPQATKAYLMLVPRAYLTERQKMQRDVAKKMRAKVDARTRLDKLLRESAAVDLYRRLAETNEEAAALLKILEE